MAPAAIVIIIAVLEYLTFGFLVGKARGRYGVKAPATTGHEVFERYFRAHSGLSTDRGGMGIGLNISHEIISRHGGRLWFESEEGKGTTFRFILPRAQG